MMAKEAHTPGPWSAQPTLDGSAEWEVVKWDASKPTPEEPWFVAVCMDDADGATSEANARLIAAAPDGYDANVAALGLLEEIAEADGLTPELDEVITGLRAAIAKARGEAK